MTTGETKNTALAVMESFQIVSRYDGMSEEEIAELKAEQDDLDPEGGILCRKIKIPSGGGTSFEVQQDDDDDFEPVKKITGVVVFTHRINGYWPNAYGNSADPKDKLPVCSSMDGKTGFNPASGEVTPCRDCPWNQYGSAADKNGQPQRGKACKNMRRLYLILDGDPNLYLLTVPPTSTKAVNDKLSKLVPYTKKVVTLSLEKTINAAGTSYSKVVIKQAGLLPPAVAQITARLRAEIETQYKNTALTLDDYTVPERGRAVEVTAEDWDNNNCTPQYAASAPEFQEAPPYTDTDAPPLPF